MGNSNDLVNQHHVFLSYRSFEVDFALRLAADLKNAGLNLWIDRLDIKPGEDWRRSLQGAVDECAALIAVLTPEYIASRYCQRELARADRFDRPIIPLLLKPIPQTDWPMEIERQQYINFSNWRDDHDYQEKLTELITHLRNQFAGQFHAVPDEETRYLTSLVAELEATSNVMEYVELAHQANKVVSDEVAVRPRPRYASAWTMEGAFSVEPEFADVPVRPLRARVALSGIAEAVERYPRFVLTGSPGSGKTTTIQHLVLAAAYMRLQDSTAPLPYFLKLTNWHNEPDPIAFIRSNWPLSGNPIEKLQNGDVALYLDGLNEASFNTSGRAAQLRDWLAHDGSPRYVIITCRSQEYSESLNLHLPTVQVAEMDRSRIQQFVRSYLDDGASEQLLAKILPNELNVSDNSRHLFQLARNPFLLSVLVVIFMRSPDGELPQNMGVLLNMLVAEMWHQEQLRQVCDLPSTPHELDQSLANLAFAMVDGCLPVYVSRTFAIEHLGSEGILKTAISAKFLEEAKDTVRFAHQLLQDYFAAVGLIQRGLPTRLEQAAINAQGKRTSSKWDAVIVALCGIVHNPDVIVRAVAEVDPYLGLQCVVSGIKVTNATREQIVTQAFSAIHGKAHPARVHVAILLLELNHEAALPVLLSAMREGGWESRFAAYDVFRQTWMPEFPGLIEALQETGEEMRSATVTALMQIGGSVLPNVLQLLRDTSWVLRRSAAWALGMMRDHAAVPALVDCIDDEDPLVAIQAISALGNIKDEMAVAPLADIIHYGAWRVRYAAAESLGRIGGQTAMAALLELLNSEDEDLRCLAVEGLKYISNTTASSALLTASYDESAEVRGAVVEALKGTEDARAVNRLIEMLTDMSWVRSAKGRVSDLAANVLSVSGLPRAVKAVKEWQSRRSRLAPASVAGKTSGAAPGRKSSDTGKIRLLDELRNNETAEFDELDSPDWMRRRKAVRGLASVEVDLALPKLIAKLNDEDNQVRLAAIQVLSGIDNEIVTEGLITALGDDDALVCDAAAQALAGQGKKVVASVIVALSSSNANVRGGAVEALAKIGDKEGVQPLVGLLTDAAQPWLAEDRICDLAARALLSIGTQDARSAVKKWRDTELGKTFREHAVSERVIPIEPESEPRVRPSGDRLLELLFDLQEAEWGKREETAKQLREYARTLKGKNATLDVQRLVGATQDEDWVVRWAASDALAWIGDLSAVPAIVALLDDENWTVRIGAVRNLTELLDPAALPALIDLASDTNHNVREVVAEALGVFGDESALDTLVQLSDDDERFVRFAAVEALGKFEDARSYAPVVKRLSDEHVTVRRAAVVVAGHLKITDAVPILIELLEDTAGLEWEEDRICDLAATALEQVGTPQAKEAAANWRRNQPELQ